MKRGLLVLLVLIVLPVVHGFGIAADNPASNAALSKSETNVHITLSFSVDVNGNASAVYFYYKNSSEEWDLIYVNKSTNFTKYSYILNVANLVDTVEAYINVTVSNYTPKYENASVVVQVKINNEAPVYDIIPNMTWPEDTVNNNLNLTMYFSDTEKRNTFDYSAESVEHVDIDIDDNTGIVTIEPEGNFSGVLGVRFTASDGILSNTSNYVLLNIMNVDDKPILLRPIENRTWIRNTKMVIKLYEYFEDVDKDKLTYTSSVENGNVNVVMDPSGVATLVPNQDFLGTDSVVFTVSDGNSSVSSNIVYLEVIGSTDNKQPVIGSRNPSEGNIEMNDGMSKTFMITRSDGDNDTLSVKWYVNDELKTEGIDSYTFTAAGAGEYTIRADVSDGIETTSTSWKVNVKAADVVIFEDKCGNGVVDYEEDCENCPGDVVCKEGEICQNKLCSAVEKKSNIWIILIIVAFVLIGTASFAVWYYKKKKSELFEPAKSIIIAKDKKTNVAGQNVPVLKGRESPAAEISDFYFVKKETSIKKTADDIRKEAVAKEKIDYLGNKKEKGHSRTDVALLRNYIKMAMEKNVPIDKIRKNLVSSGWNLQQVNNVLKEFYLR